MEPLYTAVEPDALDALFDSRPEQNAYIEFSFAGLRVHLRADGNGETVRGAVARQSSAGAAGSASARVWL